MDNSWTRPGGESDGRAESGLGLLGSDGVGPGVAGARIARPGGSGVDPEGGITGTGLWDAGAVLDG